MLAGGRGLPCAGMFDDRLSVELDFGDAFVDFLRSGAIKHEGDDFGLGGLACCEEIGDLRDDDAGFPRASASSDKGILMPVEHGASLVEVERIRFVVE